MSRVPAIDSPCPLRVSSMPATGRDHCGHCDRKVHNLDGMSTLQRKVFLSGCSGKICVAYTVHRQVARRNVSLGIGLVAAVAGSAAMAGKIPQDNHASTVTTASAPTEVSPTVGSGNLDTVDIIFVGGVNNPAEARWSDEADVAEANGDAVPEISEMEWLSSKAP